MSENQLQGTWQLVSFEMRYSDGQISYPYGQDAIGYLMYTADGYMSATLMKNNRPKLKALEMVEATIEEQTTAVQTYHSYCGKYKVQGNKVIHHVEASLFPNWIGVNQYRFFEFTGNRLLISSPSFELNNKQLSAYLIWEKNSTDYFHIRETPKECEV